MELFYYTLIGILALQIVIIVLCWYQQRQNEKRLDALEQANTKKRFTHHENEVLETINLILNEYELDRAVESTWRKQKEQKIDDVYRRLMALREHGPGGDGKQTGEIDELSELLERTKEL